jgi:hypothetical protein
MAANVHLVTMLLGALAEQLGDIFGGFLPDQVGDLLTFDTPLSSDYLIRENTLHGLNTAIESNLFDLDLVGNHITLEGRPHPPEAYAGALEALAAETRLVPLASAVLDGSASDLREARARYEAESETSRSAFGPPRAGLDRTGSLDERVSQSVGRYRDAVSQGDKEAAAAELVDLIATLEDVTSTHGIWLKGSGARITRNHVLVAPEVEEQRAPRGGIRLEGESTSMQLTVVLGMMAGLDPLLGVTETAVSENEIIGGSAYGIDVHELLSMTRKQGNMELSRDRLFETGGTDFVPAGIPGVSDLEIRENEIRGLGLGGVLVRETAYAVDVEVSANAVTGCGNAEPVALPEENEMMVEEGTPSVSEYDIPAAGAAQGTGPVGGIVVGRAGLCRIVGNEVYENNDEDATVYPPGEFPES